MSPSPLALTRGRVLAGAVLLASLAAEASQADRGPRLLSFEPRAVPSTAGLEAQLPDLLSLRTD